MLPEKFKAVEVIELSLQDLWGGEVNDERYAVSVRAYLLKHRILFVDTIGETVKTKVQKWGNSLALRIPKSFAAETLLEPDTEVELSLVEGKLIVAPVPADYVLEQLLAGVTEDNIHAEIETGTSVGHEAW